MSLSSTLTNQTRFLKGFTIFLILFFLAFVPLSVEAQTNQQDFGVNQINQQTQLGGAGLVEIVGNIINVALGLLGIVALVMALYGGYLIMTSGGNEQKVAKGKKTLTNAVIGIAIILSALAITNFVINALTEATRAPTGAQRGAPGPGAPVFDSFAASGSLGDVIADHYPFRGAEDVKRNTKISVTFNVAVAPSTVMENTNDTCWDGNGSSTSTDSICDPDGDGNLDQPPYYGDCLRDGGANGNFEWDRDCDQLTTTSVRIYESTTGTPSNFAEAAALVKYENATSSQQAEAYTFTFRPIDMLGNNLNKVWYTVELTDDIKKKETVQRNNQTVNKELFVGVESGYQWEFQTDTNFDFSPPQISSVYPPKPAQTGNVKTIDKNSIIQINFTEPMDPTSVQGKINTQNNPFVNIIFNNTDIEGEWKITNGYKTVEFVPNNRCGTNSCGDPRYCLNLNCPQGQQDCVKDFTALIRTSKLLNPQASWEAQQFTGVSDMAGNALDGDGDDDRDLNNSNNNLRPNFAGDPTNIRTSPPTELQSDNFFWKFKVRNKIDKRVPYISRIQPSVDEDNLSGDTPVRISFNMPMLYRSMNNINLIEFSTSSLKETTPDRPIIPGTDNQTLPDIWFRPVSINTSSRTITTLDHREFGPNGMNLFYITSVSSSVKAVNQNCIYPGVGPSKSICDAVTTSEGIPLPKDPNSSGCVPVSSVSSEDTGCPDNSGANTVQNNTRANLSQCENKLKNVTSTF